jgi:hypothetical protein
MSVNKVYVKEYEHDAGKYIYRGYENAWRSLGYETKTYTRLEEIKEKPGTYYLQTVGADINNDEAYSVAKNSYKAFMYAQPNIFPYPWFEHPNFKCWCPEKYIKLINDTENIFLWSFDYNEERYTEWKKANTLPMAYDSIAYKDIEDINYAYDICYVGGRANNGFDEKYKIMLEYFGAFRKSERKIGIFVSRGLTHEQENLLLYNSKVCLNIHDAYQRSIPTRDTNERTFKTLGCNGILVSDREGYVSETFSNVAIAESPHEMVDLTEKYLTMAPAKLNKIRNGNRELIRRDHTYVSRVKTALLFKE